MNVLDAAFHIAHDHPGGAAALAQRLGKASSTLSHELVGQGTAKLGLVDAVKLSHLTGRTDIVQAFAQDLGGVFLPLPAATQACNVQGLGRAAKEFGDLAAGYASAIADGRVSANELRELQREALEAIAAIASLLTQAEAVHEGGKPAHLRSAR